MNIEALLHIPDSKFCFATSINEVVLRLRTARTDCLDRVEVVYGCKYNFAQIQLREVMQCEFCDGVFNYYIIKLKLTDVRLVYVFEITEGGVTKYFSEDGITDKFDFALAYYNSFQLPYINKSDILEKVDWMKSAVFYEIFVDRFHKGSTDKDVGYINIKWGDKVEQKSFAGGDIRGIIEKLGYLESLGINVLYLTPIFSSISNHKYDIIDYYNVDKQFGSNSDFAELVVSAHERGIRIVLDAVFNHCSNEMKQFRDVIKKGKKSKYHDWFIINGDYPTVWLEDDIDYNGAPARVEKSNYECFASCVYMPKLNTSNIKVQEFLLEVASHYLTKYNIDGWRLDVSDEISHSFWRHFREKIKSVKSDAVIIGENWHDANPFLRGGEYDGIMNYAFTKACKDLFVDGLIDSKQYAERLSGLLMRNSDQVNAMMLNIIDSHDTHRFLEQCNGDIGKLISAIAIMFSFVGTPCLYYGTEIGLMGGYDPDCRRCFDWDRLDNIISNDKDGDNVSSHTNEHISSQDDNAWRLNNCIKQLIALKRSDRNLHDGSIKLYNRGGLFVLDRTYSDKITRLIVNPTNNSIDDEEVGRAIISYGANGSVLAANGFAIRQF